MKMRTNLVRIGYLITICISIANCAPRSHSNEADFGMRQGGFGWGRRGHRHHTPDLTRACAEAYGENLRCADFKTCCENICQETGRGYQADCEVVNREAARLRCLCGNSGGNGGGNGGEDGNGGGNIGVNPSFGQWRPTRPPPVSEVNPVNPAPVLPVSSSSKSCGVPTVQPTMRIVGGEQAKPHSWPWQVSIQFRGRHLCGGSIISSTNILSAAHCFSLSRNTRSYQVIVGMHDRTNKDGTPISVSKINVHPNYDSDANSNDVAVLTLSQPISFSENVVPVCIPQVDVSDGSSCEATGWGDTRGTGNQRFLSQVRVPIISKSVCNDRAHYRGLIDDTMICAGSPGKDSCQGDSGGPLVCQRSDGIWEQQGITSWGADCGQNNKPGVYTRVVAVNSWIRQAMNS